MARQSNPKKPKRVLRSVRWENDVYMMLESKSEENGGFSALVNRIAAEWCRREPASDMTLPVAGKALAKHIADDVVSRINVAILFSKADLSPQKTIDRRLLHENIFPSHTEKNDRDSNGRLWLDCPREEKDEAKKLGARWDAEQVKWFVPDGVDEEPFSRWFPKQGQEK